jgi:branched-chain amino acid transport system substrate-binding protein
MVYYITGKRSFMRLGARLDILATAAANWAKTLGASKTYIVYDGEQYGLGAADTFAVAARQAGLEVSGKEMIVQKGGNLTDIISGIKSANPDLVFYAGNSDSTGGQLLRELRAAGVDASFMGTPIIQTVAFIKAAGDSAEGVYAVVSGVMPDTLTGKGQTFAADYAAKYGAAPNSAAYFGYDAATVVLNAARKVCLKNRPALIDAMIAAQNVDGAIGQWSFDSFGDIVPPSIVGYVLKAGEWQAMTTIKQP